MEKRLTATITAEHLNDADTLAVARVDMPDTWMAYSDTSPNDELVIQFYAEHQQVRIVIPRQSVDAWIKELTDFRDRK